LQQIPGVDPEMVENIRDSVTAYYAQFEEATPVAVDDVEEAGSPQALEAGTEELEAGTPELAPGTQDSEPIPEIGGESDTIIDSGHVSHDGSEDGGSQSE
jgi:hypothetical protein